MTSSSQSFTYFSLLGLSSNSTSEDLKDAFRREAKIWHPDLNHNDQLAAIRFKWINESYRVLKDPQKRLEWEISGKPTFEIPHKRQKEVENPPDSKQERSTNGDTSFSPGEKLILLVVVSISMFLLNTFLL